MFVLFLCLFLLFVMISLFVIARTSLVVSLSSCSSVVEIKKGRYYVDFSQAFGKGKFKEFVFDVNGVPQFSLYKKMQYFPTFVGWYACMLADSIVQANVVQANGSSQKELFDQFAMQIDWIQKNAAQKEIYGKKYVVWYYQFDFQEGNLLLQKPWISALGQGACISALVRDYTLNGNKASLQLAEKAAAIFSVSIADGGVQYYNQEEKCLYLEEYPLLPQPKVFDGFVFAMLGVYDLYLVTGKKHYKELFDSLVKTIDFNLDSWTYQKKWSLYGKYTILSNVWYNQLNAELLSVLGTLAQNPRFLAYSAYWNAREKGYFHKLLIIIAFTYTRGKYLLRQIFSSS